MDRKNEYDWYRQRADDMAGNAAEQAFAREPEAAQAFATIAQANATLALAAATMAASETPRSS